MSVIVCNSFSGEEKEKEKEDVVVVSMNMVEGTMEYWSLNGRERLG
jgi:hypothetical protein